MSPMPIPNTRSEEIETVNKTNSNFDMNLRHKAIALSGHLAEDADV